MKGTYYLGQLLSNETVNETVTSFSTRNFSIFWKVQAKLLSKTNYNFFSNFWGENLIIIRYGIEQLRRKSLYQQFSNIVKLSVFN